MRGLVVAACVLFILCTPHVAAARPYTVVSCDSAGLVGYNSAAWAPFGNAGSAYESCPTGGGSTAGVSNRLIGTTYSGFSHSGHAFTAPPGAHDHPRALGGADGARQLQLGDLRPGATQQRLDHGIAAPPVLRLISFRQPRLADDIRSTRGHHPDRAASRLRLRPMPPRSNDPRTRTTSHGRRPDPAVDFVGRAAGERAVGERSDPGQFVMLRRATTPGSATFSSVSGTASASRSLIHATWTQAKPCSDQAHPADAPGRRPPRWPPFLDRFGNRRGRKLVLAPVRDVYVDNTPPDPIAPQVAGGDGLATHQPISRSHGQIRRTSAAPIVRAHWKLCTSDGSCPSRGHHDGHESSGVAVAQGTGAR